MPVAVSPRQDPTPAEPRVTIRLTLEADCVAPVRRAISAACGESVQLMRAQKVPRSTRVWVWFVLGNGAVPDAMGATLRAVPYGEIGPVYQKFDSPDNLYKESIAMTHFKKTALAAALAASVPCLAAAADKAPTLGEVLKASGVSVTGYVDTSYTYLSGMNTFTGTTTFNRVFDRETNSFNLHTADIAVAYQPAEGFGAFVQADFGADADVTAATGTSASDQMDLQEAYVQYATGGLTVLGGKFATLAGAEVIESPANLNFSRSILFGYAIPFTHTGLRASYALSDAYKLIVGVNNGWDVVKTSATAPSDGKTVELGLLTTPIKPLTINLAGYYGDASVGAYGAPRYVVDLVATYNITDNLSVTLNGDLGKQEDALAVGTDAEWSGIAAYVNWKFARQWRVAVRGESFSDKDGYRTGVNTGTGGQTWSEGTVTLAFMPSDNAELRLEGRYDKSDVATAFTKADGTTDDSLYSVALEGIYKF